MTETAQRVLEESRRFRALLPDLLKTYDGRWVVFRDGEVKSDFDDEEAAYVSAVQAFGVRGGFVIARVTSDACDPVFVRWPVSADCETDLRADLAAAISRAETAEAQAAAMREVLGFVQRRADGDLRFSPTTIYQMIAESMAPAAGARLLAELKAAREVIEAVRYFDARVDRADLLAKYDAARAKRG